MHKFCPDILSEAYENRGKFKRAPLWHITRKSTGMRRITFRSTTDRIYDGGSIRL
jgi:hypothetical protein